MKEVLPGISQNPTEALEGQLDHYDLFAVGKWSREMELSALHGELVWGLGHRIRGWGSYSLFGITLQK